MLMSLPQLAHGGCCSYVLCMHNKSKMANHWFVSGLLVLTWFNCVAHVSKETWTVFINKMPRKCCSTGFCLLFHSLTLYSSETRSSNLARHSRLVYICSSRTTIFHGGCRDRLTHYCHLLARHAYVGTLSCFCCCGHREISINTCGVDRTFFCT